MTGHTRDRRLVVVLSLSRSGSSLLARLLHEVLGVDFGEPIDHIPANRTNPDGFFENREVLKLNEDVLASIGAGVFQPPPLGYFLHSGLEDHVARMRRVIEFYFSEAATIGIKDPRLALTLPVWRAASPPIVPVIIFRDPGAAASSIVEQNGIALDHALSLWYPYYQRIFQYTTGLPRFVTSFERLIASPVEVTCQLAGYLGVSVDPAAVKEKLDRIVVTGKIRHSARAEPAHLSPFIDANTKLLYAYLAAAAERGVQPDYHHLGAVLSGLRLFDEMAAERRREAEQKSAEREAQLRSERDSAEREAQLRSERDSAEREAQLRSERDSAEREAQLRSERDSAVGRVGEIERRAAAEIERQAAALNAELVRSRSDLDAREQEIAAWNVEFARMRRALEARKAEATALTAELARTRELVGLRETAMTSLAKQVQAATAQATTVADDLRARGAEVSGLRDALEHARERQARLALKTAALATEVEAFRARRAIRWTDRLKRGRDLRAYLNPAFQQLDDDSLLFTPDLHGCVLRPSENLQTVAFLAYPLGPFRRPLCGLLLAPILTMPPGALTIELQAAGLVIAQSEVPFDRIDERTPTRFDFAPVTAESPVWLHVSARDSEHPVRLFEWQRRRLSRRAPEQRAFAGLLFAPEPPS